MPFSLSGSALNDYQRYLSLLVGNAAFVDTPALTVDYLVIAGGGASGDQRTISTGTGSGGGGAGGYLELTNQNLEIDTSYTITVGAGGAVQVDDAGGVGSNSVAFSTTAFGGGGGGGRLYGVRDTGSNGSGGGVGYFSTTGGSGTAGQGFDGGSSAVDIFGGAGGGGASAAGGFSNGEVGTGGGAGSQSSITGTAVYYAGGGGGGGRTTHAGGDGGIGGGGDGGDAGSANNTAGEAGTGGGGGGASGQNEGKPGGSGFVVAKYPAVYTMTVGAGLGYKTSISGDYKITEFTAGTGTVSFALETADLGPSEDILQEIVLEDSAASVTFSGLDAYASEYQHLQIRMITRTDLSGAEDSFFINFNDDFGSNYAWHFVFGNGSVVSVGQNSSTTGIYPFAVSGNTQASGSFGAHIIDITDAFESSKNTTIRALVGYAGGTNRVALASGLWNNTSPVQSLTLDPSSSNWIAGSRFTLIGVK